MSLLPLAVTPRAGRGRLRHLARAAATAVALALLLTAQAQGGDLVNLLFKKPYQGPAPSYARNWSRFGVQPSGHERFYAYNVEDYPWLSHGQAVPTYNYGYFGARYHQTITGQHPYYNTFRGFSYRPAD